MKTYTQAQLDEILRNHKHWILEDCDGWEGMRANLSWCDLRWRNLSGCNLSGCDLSWSDLSWCDLSRSNLSGCDLSRSNLSRSNLSGCNLSGCDLSWSDLSGCDLSGAKNVPYIPMTCPDSGEFTGWKKANGKIVKLLIPADARRSSATGRKCRCDKAVVSAIENFDGTDSGLASIASSRDANFIYTVGETVTVPDFCEDRFKECAAGIHFFINRQEVVEYNG